MINGVQRGDLYLEMTFFPNAPSKSSSLAVPSPNERPSKLSPSSRLSRPASNTPPKTSPSSSPSHSPGRSQPASNQLNRPTFTPSPPSSRVSSSSSSRQHSPFPPPSPGASIAIPPILIPGIGPGKQSPSPRLVSSSPHHDYFSALVPREPSLISDPVPQSLNPGVRRDPSSTLRPSYNLSSQAYPQAPPVPLQYVAPPADVASADSRLRSSSNPYQAPGAWAEGYRFNNNAAISFPVPQRTSPSAYDYSLINSAPPVIIPPAPLPYPGGREPDLPDPYARPLYAAQPQARGRQPFNP